MKILAALIVLLFLIAAVCLGIVYSGVYNVSAMEGHGPFERWLLNTTMENSVRRHAADITVPDLTHPELIPMGFHHYEEMCVGCHGAPGIPAVALAKGLTPHPPGLLEEAERWNAAELYWITKNGIKMTGMPAWGATHSDDELWAMVAFLRKLPSLSPSEYQAMKAKAQEPRGDPSGLEHNHTPGGASPHCH